MRRRIYQALTTLWILAGGGALWILTTTTWYNDCSVDGVPIDGTDCLGTIPKTHDGFPGSIGWLPLMAIVTAACVWVLVFLILALRRRARTRANEAHSP